MPAAPFFDRVLETTTTTGLGTLTLAGAVTGYQSFAAIGNGNTTPMAIWEVDANGNPSGAWEVATLCTFTLAGTTLTRGTFQASSTGSPINFPAGTKWVAQALPAAILNTFVINSGAANFIPKIVTASTLDASLLYQDAANRVVAAATAPGTVPADMAAFLGTGIGEGFGMDRFGFLSQVGAGIPIFYLVQLRGSYGSPTKTLSGDVLGQVQFTGHTGATLIDGPNLSVQALTDLDSVSFAYEVALLGSTVRDRMVIGTNFSTPELTITNAILELAALLKATNRAAPASPAAGILSVWSDSTDLRLHDKNSAGTIGTTVVADTGAANNFLTAVSAAGVISKAQPAFSNLSGAATFAQGGSNLLAITAGTDADTTVTTNTLYTVDMSAWATADRTYTMPASPTVGDRVSIKVTVGNASFELIIKGNTGQTINGGSAATEWSRLFISGELATLRYVATNAWIVEHDGRIPQMGIMRLSTAAAAESAATWTSPTAKSGVWTADLNVGSVCTTASDKITVRRACNAQIWVKGQPTSGVTDQKYWGLALWQNGTSTLYGSHLASASGTSSVPYISWNATIPMANGDSINFQYISEEGSKGMVASVAPRVNSGFGLTEII